MTLTKIKNIPGLHDIIEVTYAYDIESDLSWFNTTLFEDFLGVSRTFDISQTKKLFEEKIQSVIQLLDEIYGEQSPADPLHTIKNGYIEYVKLILEITSIGFDFEIQKYYPDYVIDYPELLTQKIETIEEELFGKKLIDNGFETSRSVYYLEKRFEDGKGCGSKESCEMLHATIEELKNLDSYAKHIGTGKIIKKNTIEKVCKNIQIPRNKYIDIFKLLFQCYEIKKDIITDSRSSIYDAPEGLYFPDGEEYDVLGLHELLSLMAHEVEGHYIVQKNSHDIFGESHIRGKNNLFREEGMARFIEDLLRIHDISEIDVTVGLPGMLLGEVFPGDKYLEVIDSYRELRGLTDYEGSIHSFLRRKRNYSRYLPGVQHKDVTYTRGKFMVRDYLKEGGNFKALFYAKVDFENMQLIEDTISQEKKDSLTYPKFIAQRLLNSIESCDQDIQETMKKKLSYVDRSDYDFSLTSEQQKVFSKIMLLIQPYLEKK